MLILGINNLELFYDITTFARSPYYNIVEFICTPVSFRLRVSRRNPGRCIIELRLSINFFAKYFCHRPLHRITSLNHFFTTILQMKDSGFEFLMLTITNCLTLSFLAPHDPSRHVPFPFLVAPNEDVDDNVCEIISKTFVSFDSSQLLWILTLFDAPHVTLTVTLTDSRVIFTGMDEAREKDITFSISVESGSCIIEGVGEGERVEFEIILNPLQSFYNMICWSNLRKTVWIYKSTDDIYGIIIISMGCLAQYVVYCGD